MEQLDPNRWVFIEFEFEHFRKHVEKIQVLLKSDEINRYTDTLHEDLCISMTISISLLPTLRKVLHKRCPEKNTNPFDKAFLKIVPFMRYVEKCDRAGQATNNNMAHAHYMLDDQGYKRTPRIRKTLLFKDNNGYTNAPQCYTIRKLPVVKGVHGRVTCKQNIP